MKYNYCEVYTCQLSDFQAIGLWGRCLKKSEMVYNFLLIKLQG